MMKHGVIALSDFDESQNSEGLRQKVTRYIAKSRAFLLIVVLPTILTAAYFYIIAADQYQSEAHFIVRAANQQGRPSTGFGQLLGIAGGSTQAESEASSVSDYLQSHDAVSALQKKINLVAMFRRDNADIVSRLHPAQPTPETLLKYYRRKVNVHYDSDAGITDLTVKAFTRQDAYTLATLLLELGEQRVNEMNRRSYEDAVRSSRRQLDQAEDAVTAIQSRMTGFRQAQEDIDPEGTGQAQIKLVSELNGNLAAARSQLQSMSNTLSHSSPQYVAMRRQVESLSAEIAHQSSKLAGGRSNIASSLGSYEDLRIRQEFAGKRYEMAAAAFDKAREEARDQQLYVVRVVNPNMPVKSLFPQRGKILATTLIALLLIYSIGWLIAAGVKEHAA
jgi:capsular polysaccharide transport system permease protein